jgi:lysophospholipase L1-like esterase
MTRLIRYVCIAVFLMLGAAPPARPAPHAVLAATPISRMDLPWWRKRHEAVLERIRQGRTDLVFLGDSITENWERSGPPTWMDFAPVWRRFYADRNAVNMGFKGDTTASLLWRIQNGEVGGINPKAAVILIGANNLGRVHWSASDTVAGIEAIVAELHRRLPQTRILLLGVLPSERSPWVTETTRQINAALAARYGGARDVAYLDVGPVFMTEGRVNRDLFYDPRLTPPEPLLHPSAEGQARMAAAMEPTLARLMGDRNHLIEPADTGAPLRSAPRP